MASRNKRRRPGKRVDRKRRPSRAFGVFLLISLAFICRPSRLVHLQVLGYDDYRAKAAGQHSMVVRLEPRRGRILDRNGEEVATSLQRKSIGVWPRQLESPPEAAAALARVTGMSSGDLLKSFKGESPFVYVKRKVEPSASDRVEALGLDGVGLLPEAKRYYPRGALGAHILGFVGMDNTGLEGVEARFEKSLRGRPGYCRSVRDARGQEVAAWREVMVPAVAGDDVFLTIDSTIQHIVESELDRVFRYEEGEQGKGGSKRQLVKGAAAIVMDPRTGEVLAMASRPTFSPGDFGAHGPAVWRNKVVADCYEPGSVFKIVTAAAGLDAGLFSVDERIFCENGAMRVGGRVIHDTHGYGWLSFREVVEKSSNIGITKIGKRLGRERLYRYVRAFGFGEKSGIALPGEGTGIVRPMRTWTSSSMASIPYGHEIATTPLQMAAAVAAIANGGVLMRPAVVKSVRGPAGEYRYEMKPTPVRRVVSEQTARAMSDIMAGVVEKGTGRNAALKHYRMAGKTGTAQKVGPDGRYSHTKFLASFVGFVPAEAPELVIVVMVDEPTGSYYGGRVAAPVVREIAKRSLRYLVVVPDETVRA